MGIRFIKIGLAYILFGMVLGVVIHHLTAPEFAALAQFIPKERSLIPMHAHVVLAGGFLSILAGLIYESFPRAGNSTMGAVHFWMANGASVLMLLELLPPFIRNHQFGGFLEPAGQGIESIGGAIFVLSIIPFALNVFLNVRREKP